MSKYSLKDRLNIDDLYQRFLSLAPREQMFALGGIGVLVILLLVLPITCASSKLGDLEKEMQNHEKNVAKIQSRIKDYQQSEKRLQDFEASIKPESQVLLTTLVENLAKESAIENSISGFDELKGVKGEDFQEKILGIRMSKLTLGQVVEFLYALETQKGLQLRVQKLQMKPRYDNRELFDVNFEVVTWVLGKKERS